VVHQLLPQVDVRLRAGLATCIGRRLVLIVEQPPACPAWASLVGRKRSCCETFSRSWGLAGSACTVALRFPAFVRSGHMQGAILRILVWDQQSGCHHAAKVLRTCGRASTPGC